MPPLLIDYSLLLLFLVSRKVLLLLYLLLEVLRFGLRLQLALLARVPKRLQLALPLKLQTFELLAVVLLALQRVTCALQLFAELNHVVLVFINAQLQLIKLVSRFRALLLQPLDVRLLLEHGVRLQVVLRHQVCELLLALAHQHLEVALVLMRYLHGLGLLNRQ